MILLSYVNSAIVVTKSICHDTRGLVKLFNVYYKNSVLACSPYRATRQFSSSIPDTAARHRKIPRVSTSFVVLFRGSSCISPDLRARVIPITTRHVFVAERTSSIGVATFAKRECSFLDSKRRKAWPSSSSSKPTKTDSRSK